MNKVQITVQKVKFEIQKDDLKDGQYKVVILHNNHVVGVPARDMPKREAQERVNSLRYAFEYGFMFANELIVKTISRLDTEVIR